MQTPSPLSYMFITIGNLLYMHHGQITVLIVENIESLIVCCIDLTLVKVYIVVQRVERLGVQDKISKFKPIVSLSLRIRIYF
jgi:hypothetical protein